MISVARVIEQIVDWTEEEVRALEAHLGVHPCRTAQPVAVEIGAGGAVISSAKPQGATDGTQEAAHSDGSAGAGA